MGRPTPGIKNRQWHRKLRQLGFEKLRTAGGHTIYRAPRGGRRLSTVAEGRKNHPTFGEVKTVARITGLSVEEVLR